MKFLVIKSGSGSNGGTWVVGARTDGQADMPVRVIAAVRNASGAAAPVPQAGIVDAIALVRQPAHTGKDKDGSPRDFPESYTLIV
jgi:hypothetical protein